LIGNFFSQCILVDGRKEDQTAFLAPAMMKVSVCFMTRITLPTRIFCLGLILPLLLMSCRDTERPAQVKQASVKPAQAADTVVNYDSLLTLLLGLQSGISANPSELNRIPIFLQQSFDTVSGTFMVAGKGISNPSFPEAARDAARKSAALYDGKRWGLHLKAWRTGDIKPFTRPISGEIAYSKVLFERMNGDTLFVLIQIPIGSILVR
jgi:hypothetical protein